MSCTLNQNQTQHYIDTKQLRNWFVFYSGIFRKHEAYKIWARWIITYQSLYGQSDIVLPTNKTITDLQTVIELISKGIDRDYAVRQYRCLTSISKMISKRRTDKRFIKINTLIKTNHVVFVPTKLINNKIHDTDTISIGNPIMKIALSNYNLLYKKYMKHKQKWKGMPGLFNEFVYNLLKRYDLLDGNSLQWAIPKRLFVFINRHFQCNTELFASPFNAYFKKYYSLFDEDKYFGSLGGFFKSPDSDFVSGCYEINPPFIEVLFNIISDRVISLLKIAEVNNEELTFIYIMPDWKHLSGYDTVADNKYCKKIINMNKGKHCYYYGEKPVIATFNSKLMILSTKCNICSNYAENQIKWCWKN
jgi:hypothetical protein